MKKSRITANRIKELRVAKGWSQNDLAGIMTEKMELDPPLSYTTVSNWETMKTGCPIDKLQYLSKLFECDVAYLYGDYADGELTRERSDICEATGLSPKAAEKLSELKATGLIDALSDFLESNNTSYILKKIQTYSAWVAVCNLKKYREQELEKYRKEEIEFQTILENVFRGKVRLNEEEFVNAFFEIDSFIKCSLFDFDDYSRLAKDLPKTGFDWYLSEIALNCSLDDMTEEG